MTKVTCESCGEGAEIADPTPQAFSAHPDHEAPVVIWKCPNTECGASNAVSKES